MGLKSSSWPAEQLARYVHHAHALAGVAGLRWTVETCFEAGSGPKEAPWRRLGLIASTIALVLLDEGQNGGNRVFEFRDLADDGR